MQSCSATWKRSGPEGDVLRREWQLKAIAANESGRLLVKAEAEAQSGTPNQVVKASERVGCVRDLAPFAGTGALGIGDSSFGLSVRCVAEAQQSVPGFVKNFAQAWRDRNSGAVEPVAQQVGATRLSCYQVAPFCQRKITDKGTYDIIVQHLVKFVGAHRRDHLVSGRNKGPSARIAHPLVFLWCPCLGPSLKREIAII